MMAVVIVINHNVLYIAFGDDIVVINVAFLFNILLARHHTGVYL